MAIAFDQSITQKFKEAIRREWLETNGLGGWASSIISGAHTRRYYGVLVAATRPPVGRMVMLKLNFICLWMGATVTENKYLITILTWLGFTIRRIK